MKYESLIRIFNIAQDGGKWGQEIQELARGLREVLFRLILTIGKRDIENINDIIEKIQEFNLKTKHHAIWKKGNSKKANMPFESKSAKSSTQEKANLSVDLDFNLSRGRSSFSDFMGESDGFSPSVKGKNEEKV